MDVIISRLRQKLGPQIEIATIRGQGFRLAEDARDRLRKILAEYGEDVISAATPPVIQSDDRRAEISQEHSKVREARVNVYPKNVGARDR